MALMLPTEPPEGFINLARAQDDAPGNSPINIIGVVVDVLEAKRLNNRSGPDGWNHMMTFKLLDRSLLDKVVSETSRSDHKWLSSYALPMRFFRGERVLSTLPPLQPKQGDVILIRGIRMTTFNGQKLGMSNEWRKVHWSVFPGQHVPDPRSSFLLSLEGGKAKLKSEASSPEERNRVSLAEQGYVVTLRQHLINSGAIDVQRMTDSPSSKPQDAPYSYVKTQASALTEASSPSRNISMSAHARHDGPPPSKRPRHSGAFGPKYRLIADYEYPLDKFCMFADLVGEIVKLSAESYGGYDMYITDYTCNDKLKEYPIPDDEGGNDRYNEKGGRDGDVYNYSGSSIYRGDLAKWPGPWGKRVLKINVKPPHAEYAATYLKAGDWVVAKNVKARAANGILEGDMWPDDDNKTKNKLEKLKNDHPALLMVQARRDKYWDGKARTTYHMQSKKAVDDAVADSNEEGPKLSRKQKKRLREKNKKAEQKPSLEHGSEATTSDGLSKYIRCTHEDVPTRSVDFIRDRENKRHTTRFPSEPELGDVVLPFINARYRARVRVVDFSPRNLEDFAVLVDPKQRLSEDEDHEDSSYDETDDYGPTYEWSFALCLEDANASRKSCNKTVADEEQSENRIWVQLPHKDAVFLFGRSVDDPDDLRQNSKLLAAVREQLYLLWGNLEEISKELGQQDQQEDNDNSTSAVETTAKSAAPGRAIGALSNWPFECCIWEYGVPVSEADPNPTGDGFGWRRMYAMAGTTIS